jgi:hypothetical protein
MERKEVNAEVIEFRLLHGRHSLRTEDGVLRLKKGDTFKVAKDLLARFIPMVDSGRLGLVEHEKVLKEFEKKKEALEKEAKEKLKEKLSAETK